MSERRYPPWHSMALGDPPHVHIWPDRPAFNVATGLWENVTITEADLPPRDEEETMIRRKVRPMAQLLDDPALPYHVGHLLGAAEMAAYWMGLSDDPQVKAMGEKLEQVAGWFFEKE